MFSKQEFAGNVRWYVTMNRRHQHKQRNAAATEAAPFRSIHHLQGRWSLAPPRPGRGRSPTRCMTRVGGRPTSGRDASTARTGTDPVRLTSLKTTITVFSFDQHHQQELRSL